MVKLKDELANSRVEILRSQRFREPIDIAEMHWNDCKNPILELVGFPTKSKPSPSAQRSAPMEVDISIVDIIGAEKAKQLYPELRLESSPKYKSTPNSSNSYSRGRSSGYSNLNLSGEFPVRDKERAANRAPEQRANTSANLSDLELRTAGLKTSLLLAEEKNELYDRKVKKLEEELRKVYEKVLKLNNEKSLLEKKCNVLVSQLDKVVAKTGSSSWAQNKKEEPEVQILRQVYPNTRRFVPNRQSVPNVRQVVPNGRQLVSNGRQVDPMLRSTLPYSRRVVHNYTNYANQIKKRYKSMVIRNSNQKLFRRPIPVTRPMWFHQGKNLTMDKQFERI